MKRLIFSDIHIDIFSTTISIMSAKTSLFEKFKQGLIGEGESVNIYIPWDFVNVQSEEHQKDLTNIKFVTFFNLVKEFCIKESLVVNKVFLCLGNHDYYTMGTQNKTTDNILELKWLIRDVLELEDEKVYILEFEHYNDSEELEFTLGNIFYSPSEEVSEYDFMRIADVKYFQDKFKIFLSKEQKQTFLQQILPDLEHLKIDDFEALLVNEEIDFSWIKQVVEFYLTTKTTILKENMIQTTNHWDFAKWFFYGNFLALIKQLIKQAEEYPRTQTLTFLLHFPFDYNKANFTADKQLISFQTTFKQINHWTSSLDSFFNVNKLWYERLMEVCEVYFPYLKKVNFFCWHTHSFDHLKFMENEQIEVEILNNSIGYYGREWGTTLS